MQGYKTVIFNFLAVILPALESVDLTHILTSQQLATYGVVVGMVNILLRSYTTTPIFTKPQNSAGDPQ